MADSASKPDTQPMSSTPVKNEPRGGKRARKAAAPQPEPSRPSQPSQPSLPSQPSQPSLPSQDGKPPAPSLIKRMQDALWHAEKYEQDHSNLQKTLNWSTKLNNELQHTLTIRTQELTECNKRIKTLTGANKDLTAQAEALQTELRGALRRETEAAALVTKLRRQVGMMRPVVKHSLELRDCIASTRSNIESCHLCSSDELEVLASGETLATHVCPSCGNKNHCCTRQDCMRTLSRHGCLLSDCKTALQM